jgi:hypothetical protein
MSTGFCSVHNHFQIFFSGNKSNDNERVFKIFEEWKIRLVGLEAFLVGHFQNRVMSIFKFDFFFRLSVSITQFESPLMDFHEICYLKKISVVSVR